MVFGWLQQEVVDLLRVVLPNQSLKGESFVGFPGSSSHLSPRLRRSSGLSHSQRACLLQITVCSPPGLRVLWPTAPKRAKASIPTKMLNPMIQRLSLPCRS
ncbi:hypothetical protein KC339_g111 [Hortaea werneckii]|nr:hypothetical protein KC339_g111 [Hortaea werneckii]